jgi:hypothetical protein
LESLSDNYYCLEINSQRISTYNTTYFETNEGDFFYNHHRGKSNRYKIRERYYNLTDESFLEIKFKNNKKKTIKKRIQLAGDNIQEDKAKFIAEITPYKIENISPRIINTYKRISLVNKNMKERVTLDFDLSFIQDGKVVKKLDFLGIAELKREDYSARSDFLKEAKILRLKENGFSKYCYGNVFLFDDIKKNRFKPGLLLLDKIETN